MTNNFTGHAELQRKSRCSLTVGQFLRVLPLCLLQLPLVLRPHVQQRALQPGHVGLVVALLTLLLLEEELLLPLPLLQQLLLELPLPLQLLLPLPLQGLLALVLLVNL